MKLKPNDNIELQVVTTRTGLKYLVYPVPINKLPLQIDPTGLCFHTNTSKLVQVTKLNDPLCSDDMHNYHAMYMHKIVCAIDDALGPQVKVKSDETGLPLFPIQFA